MAKTFKPVFTQNITSTFTTFVDTDGTAYKTIATGGADDSRLTHITITSDNDVGLVATFSMYDTTTDIEIGFLGINAGAGTDGSTEVVKALEATTWGQRKFDHNSNPYVDLPATIQIRMKLDVAVTAAKVIKVLVIQEDY